MALLNDIKKMQNEGKTEQEIISSLRQQGVSPREIIEALSQSKIKKAVGGEAPAPEPYSPPAQQAQQVEQEALMPQASQGMTYPDGIPPAEYAASPQAAIEQPMPYAPAQPSQPQPSQEQYQEYPQYQQQVTGISPDTISEIAEQVVSEKLSTIRKDMESIIDIKTTMGTKLSLLDERLKRIESIIDRLNLSIMQKVGDYMTNIDDIKKELIETQKSFKAINPSLDLAKDKSKKQQISHDENSA
jgi:hypothetical protein